MAKVTVIDDSQATLDMLSSVLKQGNHAVSSFATAVGVEDKIKADKPDIILLDIVMPERNGYDVLRALKRSPDTKDIPVVLISSKSEETDIRWGKRQGAADYITKPFSPDAVNAAIKNHV